VGSTRRMPYFPSVPSQRSVPIFQLLLCFFSIFSFSLISLCLGLDMVKASTDEQPLSPVARLFHVPRINCYIVISCKYEAMQFPQPCIVVGAVIFMQRRSMRGVASEYLHALAEKSRFFTDLFVNSSVVHRPVRRFRVWCSH
jgi:hypothetical protein